MLLGASVRGVSDKGALCCCCCHRVAQLQQQQQRPGLVLQLFGLTNLVALVELIV